MHAFAWWVMAIVFSAVAASPALPEGRPIPKQLYFHINASARNCMCFSKDPNSKQLDNFIRRRLQSEQGISFWDPAYELAFQQELYRWLQSCITSRKQMTEDARNGLLSAKGSLNGD
ncbi:MAG: hypothetical protein M1816_000977 [Peltula sp. TS41687]|nr:MAG: hypothetical protein M1816_000977 [Peltula sp. TS41687]